MNIEEVIQISKVSKSEQWPYPKTFQALLHAGVQSYRTSIGNNQTVYEGASNQYEEPNVDSGSDLEIAEHFQADAVKRGLEHHQKHLTPFSDFLKDMAAAGVRYYEVNMLQRTINYTSGKPGESYVEAVPIFE
jgi:uncharacterized protein YbcV (DUF1398 family)